MILKEVKTSAANCIVPTLRKVREEWGTYFYVCVRDLKAWANRPRRTVHGG